MVRCSVAATARPTFAVDTGSALAQAAYELLVDLAGDVHGTPDPVTSPDAQVVLDPQADLNVLICATFADASAAVRAFGDATAPVVLWAFREPGRPGERLWLNSLCGANLAAHALVERGVRVQLLYGNPDERQLREQLAAIVRHGVPESVEPRPDGRPPAAEHTVRAALDGLRGSRIGLVGEAPEGFTPCRADAAALDALLGVQLVHLEVADAFAAARAVPEAEQQAEVDDAVRRSPSLRALDAGQVGRVAAATVALRTWLGDSRAAALAVRCWPEFPTEYGACPCSGLGRLHDEGTPAACERDVNGAATMLLMRALGADASYLMDLVDLDADRNVVRFWHCGSAPRSLAADPQRAEQGLHCNRRLGVAGNFALRPGRVTIARLSQSGDGFRMLISGGEALEARNRFQGNTATVRLDPPAERFVHDLVGLGFEHHTVLAWADRRAELRAAAALMGIPVYEW